MLNEQQFKVYPSPDGTWSATIYGLTPDDVGELLETFEFVKQREENNDDRQMELFQ